MIDDLFQRRADPTRARMSGLLARGPLLEHLAYKFAARCVPVLQELRRSLLPQLPAAGPDLRPDLLAYWRLTLANAHLSLIGATPGARPWLADMAQTFTWVDWTPSISFMQERSFWFGAVAARQAIAFGETVVENYVRTFALATQPLRAYDAAFALLAIGLDAPHLADGLLKEFVVRRDQFSRWGGEYGMIYAAISSSAIACLRDPDAAERSFVDAMRQAGLRLEPEEGLLSRTTIRFDITNPVETAGYGGLRLAPMLRRWDTLQLYAPRSAREPVAGLGPADIAARLARNWAIPTTPRPRHH
jgi:hypothetical protein